MLGGRRASGPAAPDSTSAAALQASHGELAPWKPAGAQPAGQARAGVPLTTFNERLHEVTHGGRSPPGARRHHRRMLPLPSIPTDMPALCVRSQKRPHTAECVHRPELCCMPRRRW